MKKNLINDPFRNPFHNRFNVPVHSRLDEMQSYTHLVRLSDDKSSDDGAQRSWASAVVGAFALVLVVVFSAAFLSKFLSN